jgi:tellurite resistance protein
MDVLNNRIRSEGMDLQSSGALLRILNLVALADGECSTEEAHLLESLAKQHKLQSAMLSWQDGLSDPTDVAELARHIAAEHHFLTIKTATMVASISRSRQEDTFVNPAEDQLLTKLAKALSLSPERIAEAQRDAEEQICAHPSLWQVLYACFGGQFGSQFERQILT